MVLGMDDLGWWPALSCRFAHIRRSSRRTAWILRCPPLTSTRC